MCTEQIHNRKIIMYKIMVANVDCKSLTKNGDPGGQLSFESRPVSRIWAGALHHIWRHVNTEEDDIIHNENEKHKTEGGRLSLPGAEDPDQRPDEAPKAG